MKSSPPQQSHTLQPPVTTTAKTPATPAFSPPAPTSRHLLHHHHHPNQSPPHTKHIHSTKTNTTAAAKTTTTTTTPTANTTTAPRRRRARIIPPTKRTSTSTATATTTTTTPSQSKSTPLSDITTHDIPVHLPASTTPYPLPSLVALSTRHITSTILAKLDTKKSADTLLSPSSAPPPPPPPSPPSPPPPPATTRTIKTTVKPPPPQTDTPTTTTRRNDVKETPSSASHPHPPSQQSSNPLPENDANLTDHDTVTAEETAYLNAQLDARKQQKQQQQQNNITNTMATTSTTKQRRRKSSTLRKRTRTSTTTATTKTTPHKCNTNPRRAIESPKDTFRAYMVDISRSSLLNQTQVTALAREVRSASEVEHAQQQLSSKFGRRPSLSELAKHLNISSADVQRRRMAGTAAKNALVSANLRLVTSVANKLVKARGNATPGIPLDDMVQEGSVGLIRAAEKYDASRGYKFSTYATWWIRAYVMRSISTQGRSIKVPSSVVDEYTRIRKQYATMQERGVVKPTEEDVAAELGITQAKLKFVMKVVTQVPASLDTPINTTDEGSRILSDIVEGDDRVEERMVEEMERVELDEAMRKYLRPIERAVVRLRFGLEDGQPRSFRETGVLLGLSKERIRQVMFRALPKLKNAEIQQMLLDATTR